MKHQHYKEVEAEQVEEEGAEKARVRWLISAQDGAPNFSMRRFEVEPGGRTPLHTHTWEHEVYVLEGEGTVSCDGCYNRFRAGDFAYIAPGEEHSFMADAGASVSFLCLIPHER